MEKKIKVLYILNSLNIGGSERNIVLYTNHLDKSCFEPYMFCTLNGGPLTDEVHEKWRILLPSTQSRFLAFRRTWDLYRLLKREQIDIVHPVNAFSKCVGLCCAVLRGIPIRLMTVQDKQVDELYHFKQMKRLLSPFLSLVIADSEGAKRFAVQKYNYPPEKMFVLYDGADITRLASSPKAELDRKRKELGLSEEHKVIGVVARLEDRKKGQSYFIQSIPRIIQSYPNARFLLVGDGSDRLYLKSLVKELGVANCVIFAGSRDDLGDMLAIIDILVISSLWESIPKILVEAMACSKPIVATDVGDISELLNTERGILIPPRDPQAIAGAVNTLLGNPALAQRLGHVACLYIHENNLLLDSSIKKLEHLYASMYRENKDSRKVRFSDKLYCFSLILGFLLFHSIRSYIRKLYKAIVSHFLLLRD